MVEFAIVLTTFVKRLGGAGGQVLSLILVISEAKPIPSNNLILLLELSQIFRMSAGLALIMNACYAKFTFTSVNARLCHYSIYTHYNFLSPKLSRATSMVLRQIFLFALTIPLPCNFAEELQDRCSKFEGISRYPLVECPQAKFMVKDDLFECYDKQYKIEGIPSIV